MSETPSKPPLRLTVVHSPDVRHQRRCELVDRRSVIIGRDGSWGFADTSMSRRHARLGGDPSGAWVEDLDSKNGTWINGRRVWGRGDVALPAVMRVGDTVLVAERAPLPALPAENAGGPAELPGDHPAHVKVLETIQRAAAGDTPVLLQGEPGAHTAELARYIHARSGRSGAFVVTEAPALSAARVGKAFRDAHKGTLVIDAVVELSDESQGMLAKLLHERGPTRLVAVTTEDLGGAVSAGAFRGDLHALLSRVAVSIPPLRLRLSDIKRLFVSYLGALSEGWEPELHAEVVETLLLHPWPANESELRAAARMVAETAAGATHLDIDDMADELLASVEGGLALRGARVPEQLELEVALDAERGNITEVALRLSSSRAQVYCWLARYGIDAADYRTR